MSGICGIVIADREERVVPAYLSMMTRALAVNFASPGESLHSGRAGLGVQPFGSRLSGTASTEIGGGSVLLSFQGSLYNWQDLSDPGTNGAHLIDTLLSLYCKEKMDFLPRLRGEFVLSIWDSVEEVCYLATDPFRVYPIFYYQDAKVLAFASRMKGLRACPLVPQSIDPAGIVDIVASSIIATPKSIFSEIKKLPPGCVLSYRKRQCQIRPYWDISFQNPSAEDEGGLARQLKSHFLDAVSTRFSADLCGEKVGAFLSGGVDSSTVTGVLTQLARRPVKTFSIGFAEQQFNEMEYARIAAEAFGAEHHEYFVTPQNVSEAIPVLLDSFDEPFGNASAVPTFFCAKLARDHGVEVLYAGDGGDELFGGNDRYAAQQLFDYYQAIPRWLRESVAQPCVFTLAETLHWDLFVKAKKYIRRSNIPYPERLSSYGLFKLVSLGEWFEQDVVAAIGANYDPYAPVGTHYLRAPAQTELDRQLYIDLKLTISDNDLFKVTRMTEAAGITVRYPFLDRRLAEFAATVPAKMKMRGRQLRSFFKRAYADLLPQETRAKQKHGFGLPIPVWLRTDKALNEMMHDLVLSPRSLQRGYFRRPALENLIEQHRIEHGSFYGTILWNIMMLELWHRARTASAQEQGIQVPQSSSTCGY